MEVRTLSIKQCNTCLLVLPIERFDTNGYQDRDTRRIRKYHAHCKLCYRERVRQHAEQQIKDVLNSLAVPYECSHCGEDATEVLEFHHTDPSEKEITVGRLTSGWGGGSRERLLHELKKCIVLCSNCHRKEHRRLRDDHVSVERQRQLLEHEQINGDAHSVKGQT